MKSIFAISLALVLTQLQSCLVMADELSDAAQLVYYYTCYDLDAEVWGAGKGYLAKKCKGSQLADKRCTFDEFINYYLTGEASTTPEYYKTDSGFTLYIGDVAAMIDAVRGVYHSSPKYIERMLEGRRSTWGIVDDLAWIAGANYKEAAVRDRGILRHFKNMEIALGGLRAHLSRSAEGGFTERMRKYQEDVVWKLVDKESEYVKERWKKIDWEETVKANPQLSDYGSDLYKNTIKIVTGQGHLGLEGEMQDKMIAKKVANTIRRCF